MRRILIALMRHFPRFFGHIFGWFGCRWGILMIQSLHGSPTVLQSWLKCFSYNAQLKASILTVSVRDLSNPCWPSKFHLCGWRWCPGSDFMPASTPTPAFRTILFNKSFLVGTHQPEQETQCFFFHTSLFVSQLCVSSTACWIKVLTSFLRPTN